MLIKSRKAKVGTAADDWSRFDYGHLCIMARTLGVRVLERPMPDLLAGLYSDTLCMIIVRSDQLEHQKRVAIAHELVHALHHDGGCAGLYSKQEARARMETAARLISKSEYAEAEQLHDGNAFDISCELEVTVQCVRDYQRWLESHTSMSRITA